MNVCPNCKKPHGVGIMRSLFAGSLFPATCKACGQGFHPATGRGVAIGELVFFPFGLAVVAASSGAAATLALAFGFAAVALAIRAFVPLVPTSSKLSSQSSYAHFSDRGRLFQADRGRRFRAIVDARGRRASEVFNVSQSSTISLKRGVDGSLSMRPQGGSWGS